MHLHKLAPFGGRATGGRDWRRLERFAQMREDLPDRPRIGHERDESDVATTPRAFERKFLPQPGHEFGLLRREVSWERGLSHKSQQSPVVSPPAACPSTACPSVAASRRLPTFPMARAVTADLSL
jgi:hypothetical protein